jgi:UDP-GlcNAc:undecaprenyl-phosphate GlcNAc-1-phosphate transferase
LARWVARRLGFVSHPNPIVPQHLAPVAYLGGTGIAIGVALGLVLAAQRGIAIPAAACAGGLAFLVLGTFDDARPLSPALKLALQLAIASGYAAAVAPSPAVAVVAVLWIATVVNAVNLTDVCDGLVSALAVVSSIAIAVLDGALVPGIVAAAAAGFWWINRAPATIFLGDGGSHLLGFAIAAGWLDAWQATPSWSRAGAALLGVAVFLLELGFLIIVRRRRGIPFWRGSPDHLALRLQAAGLSKHQTVAVALAFATATCACAVWLAGTASVAAAVGGAACCLLACRAVAVLYAREPVPKAGRPREEDLA